MPSQAMQDLIDPLSDQQKERPSHARSRWKSAAPPSPPGGALIRCLTTSW
jgi:hypothetical protein